MAALFSIECLLGFWGFFIFYWAVAPWPKVQNVSLLMAGYSFVYYVGAYALLVLLSWSLCVFILVKLAERNNGGKKATVALVILILIYFVVFKYAMPVTEWLKLAFDASNIDLSLPVIQILLPLGLSFYLFNAVSLVCSVAKKEMASPDVISLFLYISFVPTLIAGPVNRASSLIPQIKANSRSIINYRHALCLIALALIKLFLLSAWLNENLIDPVFNLPDDQSGWDTIIAVYGWAWNIYFNFSGYTNLVTGIAMLLGFCIPKNFNHPYMAGSLKAFWRDWHISLSNFIRDYIYFPLGGGRKGVFRAQINVMIAMILSGIWHGAGITFLLWGVIHGAGLVIFNLWSQRKHFFAGKKLPATLARLLTFHYVCFAWVFFRAGSCDDAMILLKNIFHTGFSQASSAQLWIAGLFNVAIIIYPLVVTLRQRVMESITEIKWYALPIIIIPALAIAFFFAPSGVPGFIYANF